jgi:hypothetical protein
MSQRKTLLDELDDVLIRHWSLSVVKAGGLIHLDFSQAIQKALADARDEALEACIKIAQGMVCLESPIGPLHAAGWTGAANAIEEKIRAYLAAAHPEGKT